eukprot:jgi/Hompol1/5777/HPOL_004685-RA
MLSQLPRRLFVEDDQPVSDDDLELERCIQALLDIPVTVNPAVFSSRPLDPRTSSQRRRASGSIPPLSRAQLLSRLKTAIELEPLASHRELLFAAWSSIADSNNTDTVQRTGLAGTPPASFDLTDAKSSLDVDPETPVCRFCLDDSSAGPLVSPCQCSGSAKYVHVRCLEQWRKMALNPHSRVRCEVCHTYYQIKHPLSFLIASDTTVAPHIAKQMELVVWWIFTDLLSRLEIFSLFGLIADLLYILCTIAGIVMLASKSSQWADSAAPKLLVLIFDLNGQDFVL